ncbi:hypothetical protein ACFO5K_12980 [Nocardia halotolerans]|uniref:Uncharacterized protein n=1 Tax=Nocardia halotolerans TaxID=1755878 RepID=A0ABV8VI01_9NOCA
MTTIVVILIVWLAVSVPVSVLAARMLRSDVGPARTPPPPGSAESDPGRSFR